ncbi:thioredoxin-like [Halichoeres trimaculatus]|uniref:thioredoxin-like n=1 Tax=Halichoeres trimaculatus TaxID=147232 RepID=UPI003D9E1CFF
MDDFRGILKEAGDRLVVVDFYAKWCGPCREISPKFEEASQNPKYKNVIFAKVDVDLADKIASACGVQSMPTFQFYKNKEMIDEFSGNKPELLVQKLDTLKT